MNINLLETDEYSKLIPNGSPVRRQLLQLFIQAGLKDIEAQILLSIVLHGGKMKAPSIAKDLNVTSERLWQRTGILSLESRGLIGSTYHKPKILVLNITIDDLIEHLSNRSFNVKDYSSPTKGHDILLKIHELALKGREVKESWNLNYYRNLKSLVEKFRTFFFIIDYSLSSLYLPRDQSVLLSLLITTGGIAPKRLFYKKKVKPFDYNDYLIDLDLTMLETDLKILGYSLKEQQDLSSRIFRFAQDQTSLKLRFGKEYNFNIVIQSLSDYCLTTSETVESKHGETRLTEKIVLGPMLNRLVELLSRIPSDLKSRFEPELSHLLNAYHNVGLIDPGIFVSFIRDKSPTLKRIKRELKHSKQVFVNLAYETLLDDIVLSIFNTPNRDCTVEFLVDEMIRPAFSQLIKTYVSLNANRRGILPDDIVTFVPATFTDELVNSIFLNYDIGGSVMIQIDRTSFKSSSVFISSLDSDINPRLQFFLESAKQYKNSSVKILSLINSP